MGTPGRPPNFILQRRLAQAILGKEGTPEYKEYVATMRRHALAGVLAPALHQLFLYYGYGKPVEEIEITEKFPDSPLVHLNEDELRDRARRIAMARFIMPPSDDIEVKAERVPIETQALSPMNALPENAPENPDPYAPVWPSEPAKETTVEP
jgi:hypothetical protein